MMASGPVDDLPRRLAASKVLDDLVGRGDDVIVRDGAALLVRRGGVVVRVRGDTPSELAVAEREVALADRLHHDGVPVVEMAGSDGVASVDGFVVTCWRWVEARRAPDAVDLGRLARHLREDTAAGGPGRVAAFDPLGHIIEVVDDCGDEPHACFVRDRAHDLRQEYEAVAADDPMGSCIVHGDLHADNVVVGAEGPMVLDLELGGWGPASYDVAPATLAVSRYGMPSDQLDSFLGAYGADPRTWAGFTVLEQVYELWVTAWAVSVAHRRPEWATEAEVRVAALRDGRPGTWRLS